MAEEGFSRAESAAAVGESRMDNVAPEVGNDVPDGAGVDAVKPAKKQCIYSGAKCCCGGNLRTICVIIGLIEAILIAGDCYFGFTTFPRGVTIEYELNDQKKQANFPLGYGIWVVYGIYILCLVAACVLLVVGAWMRKKLLVLLHSILLAVAFGLMLVFLAMFVISFGTAIDEMKKDGAGTFAALLWIMPAVACAYWGLKAIIFYIYFAIVGGGLYTQYRAGQMFDGKFLNYGAQKYNYNAAQWPQQQQQQQEPVPDYQQPQPQEPPQQQSQPQSQYQSQQQLPQ